MSKDIERVFSTMTVALSEQIDRSAEQISKHVNKELSYYMAEYIIDNTSEFPNNYMVKTDPQTGNQIHTIKFNIISDDELKRLNNVENSYRDLLSKI